MEKSVKIIYREELPREVTSGQTLYDLSHNWSKDYNYAVLGAKVDNHITHLNTIVDKKCQIDFFDRDSYEGNIIYCSSAQFILVEIGRAHV